MKNKRSKLYMLVSVMLIITAFASFAHAENLFGMVDNTSSLNVRSGPGYSYQIIGRLSRGAWVDVLNDHSDWYYITDRNQQLTGYVKADFIKKVSAGSNGKFVVNNPKAGQFLNLRAEPSYDAQVIGIFYNGASGVIISSSNGWAQVIINGIQGYFREEFIYITSYGSYNAGTAYVYSSNGGAVNLRQGPGYQYNVISSFNPGTKVSVHLKGKDFWYITAGGQAGFMSSKFLDSSGSGNIQPPQGQRYAVVTNTGRRLNLREKPTLNSRSIGQYIGGTKVYIESQGVDWCKVKVLSSGKRGYMMSRYLTLYGMPGTNVKMVNHPNKTFVYLRSQPYQAAGTVLRRVPHGAYVNVVAPNGSWTKVMYGSTVGFMMSYFLK